MAELGLSKRRSCRIAGLARSAKLYCPALKENAAIVVRIKELTSAYHRCGCPRLHAMPLREELVVNRKREWRPSSAGTVS
jgi:putative transposase